MAIQERRAATAILVGAFLAMGHAALAAGYPVALKGEAGEIVFTSVKPIVLHNDPSDGKTIKWFIAAAGQTPVPADLSAWVKPASGGIALEFPIDAEPTVSWKGAEVDFRWKVTGTKAPGGDATDPFNIAVQPSYPLGPGDKLQVTVYNEADMDQTVIVDPNGNITFPVLGKVSVEGLAVTQMQQKLEDLLVQYVKVPQVRVLLLEYGSRSVNVLGRVRTSGRVSLRGGFKILDAISQSGGFEDTSGDVEIQRRDASGELHTKVIGKEQLLTGEGDKANIFVLDQDVINVQMVKSVYVNGEVKSPGSFAYDKDMTLLRAITRAGGFGQWANKSRVDILRVGQGGSRIIHANVGDIEKGKVADVPLLPNDQVVVRERKLF